MLMGTESSQSILQAHKNYIRIFAAVIIGPTNPKRSNNLDTSDNSTFLVILLSRLTI